ncbi:MAG: hypothetical protein AAFR84_21600, partial [Pseudomonadota bacterium]
MDIGDAILSQGVSFSLPPAGKLDYAMGIEGGHAMQSPICFSPEASKVRRALRVGVAAFLVTVVAGCTTVIARFPVPEEDVVDAKPYGIEGGFVRSYGDNLGEELRS